MAAVACNSSHRTTHDVELSYTNINTTNSHDERQWDDNDDAMTETDSDITRGYRGYNEKL